MTIEAKLFYILIGFLLGCLVWAYDRPRRTARTLDFPNARAS